MNRFFLAFFVASFFVLCFFASSASAVEAKNEHPEAQEQQKDPQSSTPFIQVDEGQEGDAQEPEMMQEMQPTAEEAEACKKMDANELFELASKNSSLFYKCITVIEPEMFQKILDVMTEKGGGAGGNANGAQEQEIPVDAHEDL